MADNLQVLREVDKLDRLGPDQVRVNLVDVAGVHPVQAEAIIAFVDQRFGAGVDGMQRWFDVIGTRFELMIALQECDVGNGRTAWDVLIETPTNADNSWEGGGRPENIGFALDDIVQLIQHLGI